MSDQSAQGAPAQGASSPTQRVQKFVDDWQLMGGMHPSVIYAVHRGETPSELCVEDLKVLVNLAQVVTRLHVDNHQLIDVVIEALEEHGGNLDDLIEHGFFCGWEAGKYSIITTLRGMLL